MTQKNIFLLRTLANLTRFVVSYIYGLFGVWRFFPQFTFGSAAMNKNELIAKVAKDTRLTRGEAGEAVEATIENIMRALRQGDDVRLIGFGTFTVTRRKAGEGRNPQTGKTIKLPASKRTKFKAGKRLKEAVNG
jgi:DNA-binding protein HU-beta